MAVGRPRVVLFLALALVALGAGVGAGYLVSRSEPSTDGSPNSSASASAQAGASPADSTATGLAAGASVPFASTPRPASPTPSGATAGSSASPASASAPASVAPASGTPASILLAAGAAPTSSANFDPRHTVVPMAFPIPATARYRYGALWRTARLGIVYPYNQIRGVSGATLLRAHDGVDIEVRIGTPVIAPFAGVIVNPAAIWKPWDPQRYGTVVVVRSSEATSKGYYAILVHLSAKNVAVGQRVARGQVVGRTGISGNAAETTPHLHFELRAPFPIEFHYGGVERFLDDFDPVPSLKAADPHLH